MRRGRRWVVPPLVALLMLPACKAAAEEEPTESEPFTLETIEGTDFKRVILTADAADRIDLQTTEVGVVAGIRTVPASAVWVDVNGEEWVYTESEPLVYVREVISVDRYEGELALLSGGPSVGTEVVSVGVAELIGSEFGI